jgi:hypothetical protein
MQLVHDAVHLDQEVEVLFLSLADGDGHDYVVAHE